MPLLVRKINGAKWRQVDLGQTADVKADAVTNCLKTKNNRLSVWEIDSPEDLDGAVLALVSDRNRTSITTLDVVWIEPDCLTGRGLDIEACDGDTVVTSLAKSHRDLVDLKYSSLGIVKDCIVQAINFGSIKRYTEADLRNLLVDAIKSQRLELEDLHADLKAKLAPRLKDAK